MSKKAEIFSCLGCPFRYYVVCMKTDSQIISDIESIPDWCPLPEYEEMEPENPSVEESFSMALYRITNIVEEIKDKVVNEL